MKRKKIKLIGVFALVLVNVLLLARCGGGSATDLTVAGPTTLFIVSGVGSTTRALDKLGDRMDSDIPAEGGPKDALSEVKKELQQAPDVLAKEAKNIDEKFEYMAPCYGAPWTDNATGQNVNRPRGDTGIIHPTRDGNSQQACAAAQLVALTKNIDGPFKRMRQLITTMLVVGGRSGVSLPAVGDKVSVKMPTETEIFFTQSSISRLKNASDGTAVYQLDLKGTKNTKPVEIKVVHNPKNEDGTVVEGYLTAVLPYQPTMQGQGDRRGFVVIYKQNPEKLNITLETSKNGQTSSGDFFTAATPPRLNFASAAAGEMSVKLIAELDTQNDKVTVHYAWQAGSQDGASRVFVARTQGRSEGDTGVAYFGFGPSLVQGLSDNPGGNSIWPTKMYCNWLNQLAQGQSVAKLQKQTMTFTGGVFKPQTNNVDFAPTNTCDIATQWTISNGPAFRNGTQNAVTNNFVTYTAGDISQVSVPTLTLSR